MKSTFALVLCLASLLLLASCEYAIPLTARPTHDVDPRLLDDWTMLDDEPDNMAEMRVRQFDESTYVITIEDDLYRAFHSDFAGLPLLSVQDLDSEKRLYVYVSAVLSDDGQQLTVRIVDPDMVPGTTGNRSALQKLIKANRANPALFDNPVVFKRRVSAAP